MSFVVSSSLATPSNPIPPSNLDKTLVVSFLKIAIPTPENRMDWTIEEVIMERLIYTLKEIPTPSHEELEAFFKMLLGIHEEPFEKEKFKKNLLSLSQKKTLPAPLAALCILANCRSYFSTPLGEILSQSFTANSEKAKELTELLLSCFSYLDQLLQPYVKDLENFRMGAVNAINEVKQKVHGLNKKVKKSRTVLKDFFYPNETDIHPLFKSIQGLEMRTRKVGKSLASLTVISLATSEQPLCQIKAYKEALILHLNNLVFSLTKIHIDYSNCLLLNSAKVEKDSKPITRPIDGKGYEEAIKSFMAQDRNFQTPEDKEELDHLRKSFAYETIAPNLSSGAILLVQEQTSAVQRYASLKEKALLLKDLEDKTFDFLLKKLKDLKNQFSTPKSTSWLFLEDVEEEFTPPPKIAKSNLYPYPQLN